MQKLDADLEAIIARWAPFFGKTADQLRKEIVEEADAKFGPVRKYVRAAAKAHAEQMDRLILEALELKP